MPEEREHQSYVKGIFETPFGPMDWTLTEARHVSISAGSSYDKSGAIRINGVDYHANIHLFAQPDGSWTRNPDYTGSDVYLSRTGTFGRSGTTSADKKAYEGISAAWNAYVVELEIARAMAEMAHLNNEIMSVEKKWQEAAAVASDLRERLRELETAERAVQRQYQEFTKRGGWPRAQDWSPSGRRPE